MRMETAKSRTTWGEAGPDQRSAGQRLLARCRRRPEAGRRAGLSRRDVCDTQAGFDVAAVALFTTEGQGLFSQGDSPAQTQRNLKRLGLAHQEVFPLDYCTAFRRHASKSSNVARSMCYVHSARAQHPSSLRPNEHGPGRSGKLFRHLIGQPEAHSGRCPLGPEPPVMRHSDFMADCQAQPGPKVSPMRALRVL
ncbi:hypothetical protein GGD71_006954 [Variovorax guangxiensis]|uniref:Uncharacterized protein n=1 Tax=Variovorax guangxiensis TaxID=1775474 RepID=A0A840G0Y3_9BURK|nr:hypothetical protein [Variovorax guangxiensis]